MALRKGWNARRAKPSVRLENEAHKNMKPQAGGCVQRVRARCLENQEADTTMLTTKAFTAAHGQPPCPFYPAH